VKSESPQPVSFSEREYRFDKVLATILFLARAGDRVTRLDKKKIISLLYLADRLYLMRYGRPIYGEDYRALPEGAVPQRTLDRLDEFEDGKRPGRDIVRLQECLELRRVPGHKYPVYAPKAAPDLDALSALELETINEVIERYGRMTYGQLSPIIHPPAWGKAWERKPTNKNAWRMLYEEFFEGDPDMTEGAREHMLEDSRIKRTLSGLK
jgi:uncharacterized phage-associated protein